MRLVDADALRTAIEEGLVSKVPKMWERGIQFAINRVINAPTVDPVKHGHWVEVQRLHETDHTAICECSLCGDTVWVYYGQRAWNYCPRCGAKMDEVTEDDAVRTV